MCTCNDDGHEKSDYGSVAIQLVNVGLFPCAPTRPSFAVDIDLLDFTRKLGQNTAPNLTGFTQTVEAFLTARSYNIGTVVSLFIHCKVIFY